MNANGLAVNWNPDNGQVNLNHNDVGNRDDNLGVRPEMRVTFCIVRVGWILSIRLTCDQYHYTWHLIEIAEFRWQVLIQCRVVFLS